MKQSPINIENPIKTKNFDIGIFYKSLPLNIVNNDRTLMFNCEKGCYITINNVRYDLQQFHFHSPAEHLIQNEQYDFELHLVHQDINSNIAVIGVLFAEGRENDQLSLLWEHFPLKANDVFVSKNKRMNPADLLPKSKIHYFYEGSLTTPPCTENVIWFIYTEVLELSVFQRDKFINVIGENNRSVKPINSRKVYLSG